MFKAKEQCRKALDNIPPHSVVYGRLGQHARRITSYHAAKQLFISPSPTLAQLRINALTDGKEIILPSPGLKDGFYLLRPFTIPFARLSFAVTFKGLLKYGRRLTLRDLGKLQIELLFAEALAVDEQGVRLGDGLGFFDLSCAILAQSHALHERPAAYALIDDEERFVKSLPSQDWDVRLDGFILPSGVHNIQGANFNNPCIYWDKIAAQRVRKITPLWELWQSLSHTDLAR